MPIGRRGEVWQVDLGLAAKVRPGVILNVPFLENERAVYEIVPHTTALRGTRFEIPLAVAGLQPGAFDAQGLRSVPPQVLLRRLSVLGPEQMAQVEDGVKRWLGLI
ncbi:MAG: type II toxin-antitoxin system PemK/MazF family toxin [Verrucomicrobiales bacterium]|nr:type II toxin-antitoxin system PemK/MazF family toxin [Verrucomicrobiales bacterium]